MTKAADRQRISEEWRAENREQFNAQRREPGLVLRPGEVATLLAHTARHMASQFCLDGPDCANCNAHQRLWWDLCNALPRGLAVELQGWLVGNGCDLPASPWEEE